MNVKREKERLFQKGESTISLQEDRSREPRINQRQSEASPKQPDRWHIPCNSIIIYNHQEREVIDSYNISIGEIKEGVRLSHSLEE